MKTLKTTKMCSLKISRFLIVKHVFLFFFSREKKTVLSSGKLFLKIIGKYDLIFYLPLISLKLR